MYGIYRSRLNSCAMVLINQSLVFASNQDLASERAKMIAVKDYICMPGEENVLILHNAKIRHL